MFINAVSSFSEYLVVELSEKEGMNEGRKDGEKEYKENAGMGGG
jgi:hypothetical protein